MARWSLATGRPHVLVSHDNATGTVTADRYLAHLTPEVRLATILHTSPVTGMAVDVAAVAAAIRKLAPDCFIIVDGIQHASHGHVDVADYGVDGYAISPYKVFARHGYGIGWASDRLTACTKEAVSGGSPLNWELGTRDAGSYATFSDVVDYLDWLGAHFTESPDRRLRIEAAALAIHDHEQALAGMLVDGIGNLSGLAHLPGLTIIAGSDSERREGVVSITLAGMESQDVVRFLGDRGIRTHTRKNDNYSGNVLGPLGLSSCVRISYCHYNTEHEVAQLLVAMNEAVELAQKGSALSVAIPDTR
jgi:selenocysteine lyase/cysteine desulfurase